MPPDGKLEASGSPWTSSAAGEVEHHAAVAVGRGERVVLLGGEAGQRLEPVGVVRGAVLDRPVLHRGGDDVGHGRVERLPSVDGAERGCGRHPWEGADASSSGENVAAEDRVDPLGRRAVGVEHAGGHRHTGGVGGGHGALRLAGWWWVRERAEHNHAARAGDTCRRSPIALARILGRNRSGHVAIRAPARGIAWGSAR